MGKSGMSFFEKVTLRKKAVDGMRRVVKFKKMVNFEVTKDYLDIIDGGSVE